MPVVNDYTALLSGGYWNGIEVTGTPVIVTYSFPSSLPSYDETIGGFTPATVASFQAFTATEQAQAVQALGEWSAASGLIFIQVAPGLGDINFQNVDFNTTSGPSYASAAGIGFFPFGSWNSFTYPSFQDDLDSSGDIFMNTQFMTGDSVNFGTLLHEIGHAIGFKHPTEVFTSPAATHDQVLSSDDPARTIMASVGGGSPDPHLLQLDKDAAAAVYGAAGTGSVVTASAAGTNAVSDWSWNAGTQTLTQTAVGTGATIRGSSANDVIHGTSGADRLFALAGDDFLDAGGGADSLFGGAGADTLNGGAGDDSYFVNSVTTVIQENTSDGFDAVYSTVSFTLPDNVETLSLYGSGLSGKANGQGVTMFGDGTFATVLTGGAGDDYIVGGNGADTISGGGGADLAYGGSGADLFIFKTLNDALPGTSLTTIGDFVSGEDKLDLSGIADATGQALTFIGTGAFAHHAGEVHEVTSGGPTIVEGDVDGDGTADFQIQFFGAVGFQPADIRLSAACYAAGTRVLTEDGETAVEHLQAGDRLVTLSGDARPVIWIGHRRIHCARHPDPRLVWPVRVRAGAFAEAVPHRDLYLSPDHAVFVDQVLIPIKHLINNASISQVPSEYVTYYHVELPDHDVILAEGLTAESYLDTGNRALFSNSGVATDLYPDFSTVRSWNNDAAAPLACDETRVRPVWDRLAARSRGLGMPLPDWAFASDPSPRLSVDGREMRPVLTGEGWYSFILPGSADRLCLVSRSGHPTDARPWSDDQRRLGLYINRIIFHDETGPRDLPVDHPALNEGWWDVERAGQGMGRWTNGAAMLPAPRGARVLEIHVSGAMDYRIETPAASASGHVFKAYA